MHPRGAEDSMTARLNVSMLAAAAMTLGSAAPARADAITFNYTSRITALADPTPLVGVPIAIGDSTD